MCQVLNLHGIFRQACDLFKKLVQLSNTTLFLPEKNWSDTDRLLSCKAAQFVISVEAK